LAIATNDASIAFHAESNIYQRVDGTNVYYGESVTVVAGVTAGTYFDGANGAAVSDAVDVAEGNITTNTANITGVSNIAVSALSTNGGTMNGNINMGDNVLTNVNAIWLQTNSIIYFGLTNFYIEALNGTNFMFHAGTNEAIFGSPW